MDFSARGEIAADLGRALTRTLVDAGRRGVSATGAIVLDPQPYVFVRNVVYAYRIVALNA